MRGRAFLQFGAVALAVAGVTLAIDPIAEYFRKGSMRPGWARFRPPHETSALALEGQWLWSGGRDGLGRFDWKKARLAALPSGAPHLERVRDLLLTRGGDLWAAHLAGVERRAAGKWTRFDSAVGPAAALIERRNGEIWAGGEQGLARWNGARFELVRDSVSLGFEGVDALFEDRAGALWVASAHPTRGGVGRLAPDGAWRDFTHAPGLAHPSVSSFFEDPQGGLWFASGFGHQGCACRLFEDQWSRLGKTDGLVSNRARTIFEDRRGRMWVSTETEGTSVRVGAKWLALTPQEGMTGWEVKRFAETPDGAVWLATEDGVTRIDSALADITGGTQ